MVWAERKAHRHQKPMMTYQKRSFILKIAKARNAPASSVGWNAWLDEAALRRKKNQK